MNLDKQILEKLEEISDKLSELLEQTRILKGFEPPKPQPYQPPLPFPTPIPNPLEPKYRPTFKQTCDVCGISLEGVMGFVCPNSRCPHFPKVTC